MKEVTVMCRRRALPLLLALSVFLVAGQGIASAHETPDAAEDTPLVRATEGAVDNFLAAVGHSGAINALLRNPTCSAHFTGDGIHPPGNP
jgi:hypothetical protein